MADMGDQSCKQMVLFGKNLGTASPFARNSDGKQLLRRSDGEEGDRRGVFGRRKGLLGIDLNLAPPKEEEDDGGSNSENGEQFQCGGGRHWLNGENDTNGFDCFEEEAKMVESMTLGDDEKGKTETERRIRRWDAILSVAEDAKHDYDRYKSVNRKRRTIPVVELQKSPLKKKIPNPSIDDEWLAAAAVAASPPRSVVRSTRGRAVAMPNKYRDSVVDGAAVETAAFLRHNRICNKSAAVVSSKRKSR